MALAIPRLPSEFSKIALIQVVASGSDLQIGAVVKDLLVQFFFGSVIGFAFGKFSAWLINKINLSNASLYPILLLSLVFITFTTTDLLKGLGSCDFLSAAL